MWIFTNSILLSHSFFIAHTLLWHGKRNVASFLKRRRALGKKIKSLPLYFVLILCCHLPTALIARYLRLRRARRNFTSTNKACLNLTLVPHCMCFYTEISVHKTWIGLTRYIFLKFWLCMQKIISVASRIQVTHRRTQMRPTIGSCWLAQSDALLAHRLHTLIQL